MLNRLPPLAGLLIVLPSAGALAEAPTISSLSATSLPRSGRLVISGEGFSDVHGTGLVLIDGLSSIVTTWSDEEIHAYVPEAASLGMNLVQVVTNEGATDSWPLEVTKRQRAGSILWTFQTDAYAPKQFITRGPDGTIYTSDLKALYALNPDGGLRWASNAAPGGRPISLGADGTIYAGVGHAQSGAARVVALSSDGIVLWTFDATDRAPGGMLAGPNVGPDGRIYAVQEALDFGGLGAFALDASGTLVWSNPGDPTIHSDPGDNGAITFGVDRLHTGIESDASTSPVIHTFHLEGDQLWTTWPFEALAGVGHPVMDPNDRVIGLWGQTGIRALSPDGEQEWFTIHPSGASVVLRPTVDSMGRIYSGDFVGMDLWSLEPSGSVRWVLPSTGSLLEHVAASPDDTALVTDGSTGFGGTHWLRGYATADGALLWHVDLPPEGGFQQFVTSPEPAFTPSGSTAYLTTQFLGDENDFGHVIAIALEEPRAEDLTLDGVVDGADLGLLLLAWATPDAAADINGDGIVDGADLGLLLSAWTGGGG